MAGTDRERKPEASTMNLMDSDFREKAKRVLRKQSEGFRDGGGFYSWTEDEREIWDQINALDPLEKHDLIDEVFKSQMDDRVQGINLLTEAFRKGVREILPGFEFHDITPDFTEYEKKRIEHRERFRQAIERMENASEDDLREMGNTPEERFRWLLRQWFPPTSS